MLIPPFTKQTVGFLHVLTNKGYAAIGTCFFINVQEFGQVFSYVVTCKHVIEEAQRKGFDIYLRLNRSDILDIDYIRLPPEWKWIFHDDPAVDIAVSLRIGIPNTNPVGVAAMDVGWLVTKDRILTPLLEGIPVFFIGLLAQYQGYKRNYPVVRQGQLALVTDEPLEGVYGMSDYYLVECQAWPGNSGSPLFMSANSSQDGKEILAMLGVVSGFYPHRQQMVLENGQVMLYTHLGLSLITPAYHIREVLDQEVFVADRKAGRGAGITDSKPEPASLNIPQTAPQIDLPILTREEFMKALTKVSRPDQPQPAEGKKGTSE